MGYLGKLVGGVAGFAVGGPFGAVMGAALGHAADSGALPRFQLPQGMFDAAAIRPARLAGLFAPREQVFSLSVVTLAAKLAKADGPVNRAEIDAFKRYFRIPPENARNVGRLFDQARDTPANYLPHAERLGEMFADNQSLLEDVLAALFAVARSDGEANATEMSFLAATSRAFGLSGAAWERAKSGTARGPSRDTDPYAMLGVPPHSTNEAVREAWKQLMRENHPDSLASRGVPPEFIASASEKVARINAAWDRVKRERQM